MRKIIGSILAVIFTLSLSAQTNREQNIADRNTAEWRYDAICSGSGGAETNYLIRISVYVPDQRLALEQAKKNAVHAVLFKGVSGNNQGCSQKDQLVDYQISSSNIGYFNNFFNNNTYSRFATSPTGVATEIVKLDRKNLRVDFVISVQIASLRSQLETDGILSSLAVDDSVQKPSIIIFPSEVLISDKGWTKKNSRGEDVADFEKAFLNFDVNTAITELEQLLIDRGFQPKSAQQTVNALKEAKTIDEVTMTETSDLDKLLATAKADIRWEVTWKIIDDGFDKQLQGQIRAFDAYMNVTFAAQNITGPKTMSGSVGEMIRQGITDEIDAFLKQHQNHFKDIVDNGRKVKLEFRTNDLDYYGMNSSVYFSEFNSEFILGDLITNFVGNRAKSTIFDTTSKTQTQVNLENVRIDLMIEQKGPFGSTEIANNPEEFLKEFQKVLSQNDIPSFITNLGLGRARLTFGESF